MNFLLSKNSNLATLFALLLLLSGCSSFGIKQNPENIDWSFSGKMAIRNATEATSFSAQWQQLGAAYNIRLYGPFGAGEITIEGRPGNVTLQQGSDVMSSYSLNDLVYQATNMDLPLDYLQYWVRATPAPKQSFNLTKDTFGHVTEIEQAGWTVSITDYFDEVPPRPRKLSFVKAQDSGKLIIREWNTLPLTE